jgi:hypothetical protein
LGTAALPCGRHGRGRIRDPAAAWRAPTLATQAASRQLPPGQEGGRPAWGSCGLGDRFLAALVQRAELQAAHGPGGPEVAHDPEHVVPPRVHQSQRACTVSDCRAEILLIDQESCSSMRPYRARWLNRDNARAGPLQRSNELSTDPTFRRTGPAAPPAARARHQRPPRRPAAAGRPGRRRRLHPHPAVDRLPQAGTPTQTAKGRPPAALPGLPHTAPAPPQPPGQPNPAG